MPGVSIGKAAEGCATPIKLASHPPSLLLPFLPQKLDHSSRKMANPRGQLSEIRLQQSRRLLSRAVPYGLPVYRSHHNGNKSARRSPLHVHRGHGAGGIGPQQAQTDESNEYASYVRQSNASSDVEFIPEDPVLTAATSSLMTWSIGSGCESKASTSRQPPTFEDQVRHHAVSVRARLWTRKV
jgi:hypothetical protein